MLCCLNLILFCWQSVSDMSKSYSRELDGIDEPLLPPSMQYFQFAQQQRLLMKNPEGDRLLEYWERQLVGMASCPVALQCVVTCSH